MQDDPREILKKHGKTFNFARLFLDNDTGIGAARLYRFCRIVDDIADDSDDKNVAKLRLEELINAINDNCKKDPVVADFLQVCEAFNINRIHGITLIEGVTQDLDFQALDSEEALIQYAYKVAGVVGLMMAPILGSETKGYRFAVDLGIGMQLTNIARDVMEDAQMGRRYIPAEWLNDLAAEQIKLAAEEAKENVQAAIALLLGLAETYYDSGLAGLYYLPRRNRQAIAVAAYVYREIGRKLTKNNHQYWQGRVVVGGAQKIKLAGQALWHLSTGNLAKKPVQHNVELHNYLQQYKIQDSDNPTLINM
jgi:phytoene synthase